MRLNGKIYTSPETYSVLLSATKSRNAANAKHVLKDNYGVPEMVRDFEHMIGGVSHGVGNAYRDMNMYQKGLFWMFLFSMGGAVLDTTLNNGKVTKDAVKYAEKGVGLGKAKAGEAGDILQGAYAGLIAKKTSDSIIAANSSQNKSDKIVQLMKDGTKRYFDRKTGQEVIETPTPKPTPTPHQFTPDMKVFGSEKYQNAVQGYLEEIKKTPDTFLINGMTAYEYVTYYIDELHEGEQTNIATGSWRYPLNRIDASNLIHLARHIEQGQSKTFLYEMHNWELKGEDGGLFMEHDAIKLQTEWAKARYNSTDELVKIGFLQKMKQYTKDPKYFEDELSVD